jgi:hypothetical protein
MSLYLGIEITDGQLRVVQLRAQYRKLIVEAIYRIEHEAGTDAIQTAMQTLRGVYAQPPDAVFAAISGTDATLRPLSLPRALLRRGPKVLAAELDGELSYDVDEAVIDAQVVRDGEVAEVIAAAVRIDRLQPLIAAMQLAELEPRELSVLPLALGELSNAYVELSSPDPILLIHAYETRADVCVVRNGKVQFARTITGQTRPDVRERHVRQTMGAYLATGGSSVVAAYVLGEEGELFESAVMAATGLDSSGVRRQLPLSSNLTLGPNINPEELRFAPTALALALRGVSKASRLDLRKGPLALSGNAQILRERMGLFIAAAAAIAFTWLGATAARYYSLASERDRLTAALGVVTLDVFEERITDPQRAITKANGTGETIQDPAPPADAFDVIGVLSDKIPVGTRNHDITQLEVTDEHVQIQGIADTLQDRDSIVDALKTYPCFQTVTAGRTQRNQGDERQQYALDIEFRCPGRTAVNRRNNRNSTTGTSNTTPSAGGTTGGSNGTN